MATKYRRTSDTVKRRLHGIRWVLGGEILPGREVLSMAIMWGAVIALLAATAFVAGVHYGVTHGALPFPGL